jgi:hypothetical protein
MKINLKELLCWHEWEYLENPDWNSKCIGKVKCVKCEKRDERYVKPEIVHRRLYMWCDKCGNELNNKRNHIQHLENCYDTCSVSGSRNNNNSGVYLYECCQCGKVHIFDFNIGPGPIAIKLTDKVPVLTLHKDCEKHYELIEIKGEADHPKEFEGSFIGNPNDLSGYKIDSSPIFRSKIDLDEPRSMTDDEKAMYEEFDMHIPTNDITINDHYGIIESMNNILKSKEDTGKEFTEEELKMKKLIDETMNNYRYSRLMDENEITETHIFDLNKELRSKMLLTDHDSVPQLEMDLNGRIVKKPHDHITEISKHPSDLSIPYEKVRFIDKQPIQGIVKLHNTTK